MRYLLLRANVSAVFKAYPNLRLIIFEQAHHRGGHAAEYGIGVSTHIQSWCAEHKVDHKAVHSATLKKWATGSGRSDKTLMRASAFKRFGQQPSTDDEADAMWLLDYGRRVIMGWDT